MFIKVKVQFEVVEGQKFTLSVGCTENDQSIMQFASSGMTVREELFDVAADTENLQVSVLSEEDSKVDHLDIAVKDIIEKQKSEWMLLKEQYKITIIITPLDEAPADWFERGISLLAQEEKPWYLTTEDLYKCTKDLMTKLTEQVSTHVAIPSSYLDEMLVKLDFVSSKVAEKLLHIQLEEGFSLVAKIDEVLEQVLGSTDEHVDEYRLKLALKLQQLRKSVTLHLQELSQSLTTKTDVYRTRVEEAVSSNKEKLDKSVATAYTWAADTSASTSNWLAKAEHTAIINKMDALRLSGKEVLEQTQTRVLETRDQVVNTVTETRDQVVNTVNETRDQMVNTAAETRDQMVNTAAETRDQVVNTVNETRDKVVNTVQTKLTAADEALRVQLPEVAHPYVVQAVSVSQPYVETAVTTASPYIQTVRDQESVKKLESWVKDKKKDELLALLEKNKDTPAGSMVSGLLSQASRVITEVSEYCLNEDYFARNQAAAQTEKETKTKVVSEQEEEVKEEMPVTWAETGTA